MEEFGVSERIVLESGCGLFQVLLVLSVFVLVKHPAAFTMMFMSFGNYNPGWRCLDKNMTLSLMNHQAKTELNTQHTRNDSSRQHANLSDFDNVYTTEENCELFEACRHDIEFNPQTSTITSEWGLLCDRSWITSVIIASQMAGVLIGCFVCGQLGDAIGRKKTFYFSILIGAIFSFCAAFSPSWEAFAVFRFFIGTALAGILTLYLILPTEFLTPVWRARMPAIPVWNTGGMLLALLSMWCEDWKTLHLVGGVFLTVSCLPAIWVPESIRWLEVNHKHKEFEKVVSKINFLSKKKINIEEYSIPHSISLVEEEKHNNSSLPTDVKLKNDKKYTIVDIFRKGYRIKSSIIGFICFFLSITYYAISFGVKGMPGDFYTNLIVIFVMEIPFCFLPMHLPNWLGRQRTSIIFITIGTICLLLTAVFEVWTYESVKRYGVLVFASLAKTFLSACWHSFMVLTAETYPTLVRSIGVGYGNMVARIGGILAPFLIPDNPDDLYICYLVMGCLGVVSCIMVLKLPETKGKRLKETFSDDN